MSNLHVIFGSGQIGSRVARLLLDRGDRVRVVARHPKAPAGAETRAGDARDLAFAAEAATGATTVIDTMSPPYHQWKTDLLPTGTGSLHAATVARARLVAFDCLYMYGAPAGPMVETTAIAPRSRKGTLRAELAELRLAAMRRGDVQVTIGRASDFFGVDLAQSYWSVRAFTRLLAGKPVEHMGDVDMPHSYSYADDVARGLVALVDADDATGVWHLPTLPAESTRALGTRVGAALGVDRVSFTRLSPLLLRALGLFAPMMRELIEMGYQWESPFVLDDSKFCARFGFGATPIDEQIATTVTWIRTLGTGTGASRQRAA